MQINITQKTNELKNYISQFETISFITQYYYAINTHIRRGHKLLNIQSPHRQILYLLSLFLDTPSGPKKIFDPIGGTAAKIESLLELIETGYRENYFQSIENSGLNNEVLRNHLLVANQTFINYFVNGDLNYVEQEIDRIQRTFMLHRDYILTTTGLTLDDFLYFYDVTEYIDNIKLDQLIEDTNSPEVQEIFQKSFEKKIKPSSEQFEKLLETVDKALFSLPIPIDILFKMMDKDKVEKLLTIFSIKRTDNNHLRFYTDECPLLNKPIIWLHNDYVILPVQKQLIHAIFNFLFEICKSASKDCKSILIQKDKTLEEKTFEIFNDFFDGKARIFKNYFVAGFEKDLIVLYRGVAFIIESKAHDYREPFRDPAKAYNRIRDDFKKSIQKGYDQTWAVKRHFIDNTNLEIQDKNGRIIEVISTYKYRSCFSIIVTNERYGQIQCDLGLLLELEGEDNHYPWAVYVDDLETFLITLKRKDTFFGEFTTWLNLREKLHERLICFDELEICTYFLTQPQKFACSCKQTDKLFLSSPDMHLLFDQLYQTGLGFKNERHLDRKTKNDCSISKILKLKRPANIKNYKKQNSQS